MPNQVSKGRAYLDAALFVVLWVLITFGWFWLPIEGEPVAARRTLGGIGFWLMFTILWGWLVYEIATYQGEADGPW